MRTFEPMPTATIFHPDDYSAIRRRIENLRADSPRQWGKMTPAQMLAHVNLPLETGLGKVDPPREGNFITRPLARWYVLSRRRLRRNLPTLRAFVVRDDRNFNREKERLLNNLAEAFDRNLGGTWFPHHAFGILSPRQWGELNYLHLDHHFRQFGV